MKVRTLLTCLLTLIGFGVPPVALGQQSSVETAPKIDSTSPGGVSYSTGAFTYEVPVLSIGPGSFPQSLQLIYEYRSDGARSPNAPWKHNFDVRSSRSRTDTTLETGCPSYCNPGDYTYSWNIVVGQRSASFYKIGYGNGAGPYTPQQLDGSSLTWQSTGTGVGKFTYTSGDGARIVFSQVSTGGQDAGSVESWTEPDGTTISYVGSGIATNRGLALFFSGSSVCAVNLTIYYLQSLSTCPAGVPTAVKSGASITDAVGRIWNFTYGTGTQDGTDGHLICVKEPGETSCTITNAYDNCDGAGKSTYADPSWNGSRDRVISQTFVTGETIGYTYTSFFIPPAPMIVCRGNSQVQVTRSGSPPSLIGTNPTTRPFSIQNELGSISTIEWVGPDIDYPAFTRLGKYISPDGNIVENTYDIRGNVTLTRKRSKPGYGLADVVTSAAYPTTCSNNVTCNKPTSITDANGNVTSFTYDPVHGGVLTETSPAVGGVSPQKRYEYAQRYAWIKNAGGTYSQAASPVWVLVRERSCKTTAASGASCAGGAADEVVTDFDYGPNSGPNNLWLRGVAVTATNSAGTLETQRTCHGYDVNGRKISETAPLANLATCP